MKRAVSAVTLFAVAVLAGCSSTRPVNLQEPRRLVAIENEVRLDAEITAEDLSTTNAIPIHYTITNGRATAIAVADIVSDTTYDPDSQIVTVTLGAEVPGENVLPRLFVVQPGEQKSFDTVARISLLRTTASVTPDTHVPGGLRISLNFLGDVKPFAELIGITQRAVVDPEYAARVFPKWVEQNENVTTNPLPMHYLGEWRSSSGSGNARRPQS